MELWFCILLFCSKRGCNDSRQTHSVYIIEWSSCGICLWIYVPIFFYLIGYCYGSKWRTVLGHTYVWIQALCMISGKNPPTKSLLLNCINPAFQMIYQIYIFIRCSKFSAHLNSVVTKDYFWSVFWFANIFGYMNRCFVSNVN